MNRKILFWCMFFFILGSALFLTGCNKDTALIGQSHSSSNSDKKSAGSSNASTSDAKRESVTQTLIPQASGTVTYGTESISIDASNTGEGYVMVQYNGTSNQVRMQVTIPDGTVYTYALATGKYETFPLTGGNGSYHIGVLEHAYDDMYALAFSQDIDVTLNDEFKPFLYPNQYAWYTQDNQAVKYGIELSEQSSDDLNYAENVYHYVIENIDYDKEKAENVQPNYLPDIDETMETGKGICFDYASLMTAMLRSQGIPTRLEIGYSGEAYHAWISVYLEETGWIDKVIEFDGSSWTLMDPTLGASNNEKSVGKYIGDGSNYVVKYSY